jgi:hypothetical protein
VLSDDFADLLTPGVIVELDAVTAADLGAFLETALTEEDAWDANVDLPPAEADDGE